MGRKARKARARDLEVAVRSIVLGLRQSKIRCMLIGALALPVWGRPRATLDVDHWQVRNGRKEKETMSKCEALLSKLISIGVVLGNGERPRSTMSLVQVYRDEINIPVEVPPDIDAGKSHLSMAPQRVSD